MKINYKVKPYIDLPIKSGDWVTKVFPNGELSWFSTRAGGHYSYQVCNILSDGRITILVQGKEEISAGWTSKTLKKVNNPDSRYPDIIFHP